MAYNLWQICVKLRCLSVIQQSLTCSVWTSIFVCVCLQFCGRGDEVCERLVCRLGNLEAGRDAIIQLEIRLNPAVLLQAPVTHTYTGQRWKSCACSLLVLHMCFSTEIAAASHLEKQVKTPDVCLRVSVSGSSRCHEVGEHSDDVKSQRRSSHRPHPRTTFSRGKTPRHQSQPQPNNMGLHCYLTPHHHHQLSTWATIKIEQRYSKWTIKALWELELLNVNKVILL